MSVVLSRASSQYLTQTLTGWEAKPLTISVWFRTTDDTNLQAIVAMCDQSDEFFLVDARMAIGGNPAAAMEYNTAWKVADSSTGITTSTWHHAMAVFKNSTSRTIYLDGVGKVTNTDSQDVNVGDLTRILIGTHKEVGGSYFDGNIAEVAIWQAELTDANAVSLAGGAAPADINSNDLSRYWRLVSDGTNEVVGGGGTLSAGNGATYDANEQPTVDDAYVFNYPTNADDTIYKRIVAAGNDTFYYEAI